MKKWLKDFIFLLKHASELRGYYNYLSKELEGYHREVGKCFLKMSSTENFLREAHKEMRLRITKMEEAVDRKVIQCVPNPYDTYQELDERCSHCQLLRRIICIACSPEKEEE
ncbi:hypothetical protein J6U78_03615 [bacterium]|nr:hypothetical protein [bacterium]